MNTATSTSTLTSEQEYKMKQVARYCRPVKLAPVLDQPNRRAVVDELTGQSIATVSNRYTLVNNADVIRPIVDRFGVDGLTKLYGYGNGKYTYGEIFTGREFNIEYNGQPDIVKERLIFQNSYDKTKRLVIMLGAFRKVCANGMFTGTAFVNIKTKHVGDIDARGVLDAVFTTYSENAFDLWRDFAKQPLSVAEELQLAESFNAYDENDDNGQPLEANRRLNRQIRQRARWYIGRVESTDNRRDGYGLFNQLNRAIGTTVTAKSGINRLIAANMAAEAYVKGAIMGTAGKATLL